jgi:lipopolysaccharide assembly protein A
MRLLSWILLLALLFGSMVFAVSNSSVVTLSFLPLFAAWEAPLYAVVVGALAVGLLIGVIYGWLMGGPSRKRARFLARENRDLRAEIDNMNTERTRALRGPGDEDMD